HVRSCGYAVKFAEYAGNRWSGVGAYKLIVLCVHNRFARLGSVDQSHAARPFPRSLSKSLQSRLKSVASCKRDTTAMKRDVDLTWAAERIESALFREQINEVA